MSTYFYVVAEKKSENGGWVDVDIQWNYLGTDAFAILGNFCNESSVHLPVNNKLPTYSDEIVAKNVKELEKEHPFSYPEDYEIDHATYDVSYETLSTKRGNYVLNVLSMDVLNNFNYNQLTDDQSSTLLEVLGDDWFTTELKRLTELKVERVIIMHD